MRKEIAQMAEQAGFNLVNAESAFNGQILPNSLERFANNIIRECARLVDSRDSSHPASSFGDMLLDHFNIEDNRK